MIKYTPLFFALIAFILINTACEKMLDTDSEKIVLEPDHKLDSPDEIIYSMIGILSQLEKLSESYVLLGELRGDLMDASATADPAIREIYEFSVTSGNKYNNIENYYSIINDCNYLIQKIDTSIESHAEKVMYREFAAAKAIRAWTYIQMVLNYGTVQYIEEPILDVADAAKDYPEYSMDELAPVLVAELEPFKDIPAVESISLGEDITTRNLFFPVRFLLGDLYLWMGDYEQAAKEYHDLMQNQSRVITDTYRSEWDVINGVFVDYFDYWSDIFDLVDGDNEQISMLARSTEYGAGAPMDSITIYKQVLPSSVAIANWKKQVYFHSASAPNPGDLREVSSYTTEPRQYYDQETALFYELDEGVILKFLNMSTETSSAVQVYRNGLLYLRFAEAVNRAGKPNAAFAVLKYGMNRITFESDSIVPVKEKYSNPADSVFFPYLNFTDPRFNDNIGVHSRGCGNTQFDNDYRIPSLASSGDSILYVEDLIMEELALETAFEGNRFHDLMRIALRRNSPSYLADKVSEKYDEALKASIRTLLSDPSGWYIEK